jgi:hypothetical protein
MLVDLISVLFEAEFWKHAPLFEPPEDVELGVLQLGLLLLVERNGVSELLLFPTAISNFNIIN